MEKVRCILRATALTDTLMTSASTPTSSAWSIAAWLRRWPAIAAVGEWGKTGLTQRGCCVIKKIFGTFVPPPDIFRAKATGLKTDTGSQGQARAAWLLV